MSNFCSLAWCRKPITNRKKSKRFPPDRPSQLAWLDALDAGAWFSIPQDTLATGLILCEAHFDSRGSVRKRYDSPAYPSSAAAQSQAPVNIKLEPNASDDEYEEPEPEDDDRLQNSDQDSDYAPDTSTSRKSKRASGGGAKNQQVFIKIKRKAGPSSSSRQSSGSKRARRGSSKKKTADVESGSDEQQGDCFGDGFAPEAYLEEEEMGGDYLDENTGTIQTRPVTFGGGGIHSIDSERLSELTSDALEKGGTGPGGSRGEKRQSVTLMQKMEVIRLFDKGMKQTQIAKKLSLKRQTVSRVCASREKIEQAYQAGAPLRKRIVRRGAFADVNEAVYQWYEKVRTQNLYVNARVLLTMAENIANELGRSDFSPTPSWLNRFKERYNIRFTSTPSRARVKHLKIKQERQGGDAQDGGEDEEEEATAAEMITSGDEDIWLKKDFLRNTWPESRIKNLKTREAYQERDIFFVEELGILFRITPKQAWQFRNGKSVDHMENFSITEERLTVLICSNADGSEKRRLVIAGQQQNGGMPGNLPADYVATSDQSNWITKNCFFRWISKWNADLQSQNRMVILISNTSPLHNFPQDKFSNIKMVNIPTRLLGALHPVNFGIATNFKTRYRRLLLEKLISSGGYRPISCLDAVFMLSTAWNELSPGLIRRAFLMAGYFSSSDIPSLPEDEFDVSGLISKAAELDLAVPLGKYPFSEYVEIDNSLCAIECTVLGGGGGGGGGQGAPASTEDYDDFTADDVMESDAYDNRSVNSVPVQCSLSAGDAQIALGNLRLFAMSRNSCPQEVHNALSTLESFLLGHNS